MYISLSRQYINVTNSSNKGYCFHMSSMLQLKGVAKEYRDGVHLALAFCLLPGVDAL